MAIIAAALLACAANIAPATLAAIVAVESRGDPLAIDDDTTRRAWHPQDRDRAIALVARLIAAGHRLDLGLMQVSSPNLPALGLTVAQVLDPCTNLRAGGTILTADYATAAQRWGAGQEALRHALAAYNTGSFYRGTAYVARYYGPATVPAVNFNIRFAALGRGRENQHGLRARPGWTDERFARLTAATSVYRRAEKQTYGRPGSSGGL